MVPLLAVLAVSLFSGAAISHAAVPPVDGVIPRAESAQAPVPSTMRSVVFPSPFTDCPANTGGSATVLLPQAAATAPVPLLDAGDELAVLAPDGSCVGHAVWDGDGMAFSVWADDPFTAGRDGLRPGEPLALAVWDASEAASVDPLLVEVIYQDSYDPGAGFASDGLYIVEQANRLSPTSSSTSGPALTALEQNRPNPVRTHTTFAYSLAEPSHVTLDVFDALGRRVAQVVDAEVGAGEHEVSFDTASLAGGVYVYRLAGPDIALQRRMMVVR